MIHQCMKDVCFSFKDIVSKLRQKEKKKTSNLRILIILEGVFGKSYRLHEHKPNVPTFEKPT